MRRLVWRAFNFCAAVSALLFVATYTSGGDDPPERLFIDSLVGRPARYTLRP